MTMRQIPAQLSVEIVMLPSSTCTPVTCGTQESFQTPNSISVIWSWVVGFAG